MSPRYLAEVLFATEVAATSNTMKLFCRKSGTEFILNIGSFRLERAFKVIGSSN